MQRQEFRKLVESTIEQALANAEQKIGHPISHNVRIELHGAGHLGDLLSIDETIEIIYLSDQLFYRVVDVAVIKISESETIVFFRVSGHKPTSFEKTWNDPPGFGPFRQLIADKIRQM